MKRLATLLVCLAVLPVASAAERIVVLGTLVSNGPMKYVPDECPADAICMHSWFKSIIKVRRSIAGSPITGRVTTATLQHTSLNVQFKKNVRLFVLEPINDSEQRAKLRADYYLVTMAAPSQMYCLPERPDQLGLDAEATYSYGTGEEATYCFELPTG